MFLNFQEISKIPFKTVLDHFNVSYEEKKNELKGHADGFQFIVNTSKNMFFSPSNQAIKGSCINFLSALKGISLREAAAELKSIFLDTPPPCVKKVPDLTLEYHKFLEEQGITEEQAKEHQIGYCKQGIMKGRIAFAIYDQNGQKVAYCGLSIKEDKVKWLFPKGYQHIHIYGLHRLQDKEYAELYVDPLEAIKNNGLALLTPNATNEQIELLGEIKRIKLNLPNPDNIALRLCKKTFVKC